MIQAIVFDCFGVLYNGSHQALYEQCETDEQRTALQDAYMQADYGYISYDAYIDLLAEITGSTRQEIIDFQQQTHVRNTVLVEYLLKLKKQYKIGLLSNVSEELIDHLFTRDEQARFFDAMVLSYREHIAKPNPEIFTLMAERLGVPTADCVMIDDIADNCAGAEFAGMRAIHHTSNDKTRQALDAMGVSI